MVCEPNIRGMGLQGHSPTKFLYMDEIINDDGLEKEFDKLKASGKLKACPNLSHLPDDEKRQIMKEVSHQAAEMMMRTYISLGVMGETIVGLEDGFTKCTYEMVFKSKRKKDEDSDG